MTTATTESPIYQMTANNLAGKPVNLGDYRGQVLLIVNTASKCGLTPQFEGLQALHEKYHQQGLTILGFPCNQFAGQEPNEGEAIGSFCQRNYGVSFPMFDKIDVNGSDAHPLYKHLVSAKKGFLFSAIKWNFTKFLVDRHGNVIERYAPTDKPENLSADIEKLL